jgi:acetyl esterase/lipase
MTAPSLLDPQLAPLFIGVPTPAFSSVTLPMLRQVTTGAPFEGAEHMCFAWASYLDDIGSDDVSVYAAPAQADNLAGLPTVFLALGALDTVIDENLKFAQHLIHDGVPTTLHVFSGAPHGFDRLETAQ